MIAGFFIVLASFAPLAAAQEASDASKPSLENAGVSGTVLESAKTGGPPPADALVAVGGDSSVGLTWLKSPGPGILGYNVYRSTASGSFSNVPVNRALITGTEFTDNFENSTSAPDNGRIYYYTVKAVTTDGMLSAASEEARASPEGAPVISEVPKVGWEGFGESQLSVSGRKVVSMGYTVRTPKYSPGSSQLSGPQSQRLNLEQQLQVRLSGTVGKKIAVDVDYDDTAPDQARQKISVVYTGDPQETIERAEFGDIRLQLSDTEFTGYDKQLFGVRVQARPIEKLRVTGVATQTQGINATEQFVGNNAKQEVEISDTAYVSYRYFYITRPDLVKSGPLPGIRPGSEQIWMDDGIASNNSINTKLVGDFAFDYLYQGVDYSIDYATGVIILNRNVAANAAIAAAFEFADPAKPAVDFTGGSVTTESQANLRSNWDITSSSWAETTKDAHMIYDGPHTGAGDAHMITSWYQLGYRNIVPKDYDPEFTIRIVDGSGNEVGGIIAAELDSDFYDFGILKLSGAEGRGISATGYPSASEQPFAYRPDNTFYGYAGYQGGEGCAYAYGTYQTRMQRYVVKMRFLTRLLSYRLRNINIVRGSERIKMDGRILRRDVDYFIDYDFGQVTFLRPGQIRPDSQIQIDYEYLPFGGQFQSFLWGARAQYSLSEKAAVGATFLSNNAQNPKEAPSPTAAPKSTSILGADGRFFLTRRDVSSLVQVVPGFENSVIPLQMEIRGEVARSDLSPNTFTQAGVDEKGVGMIDSMEGVDDVVEAGVDDSLWFPSAVPEGGPADRLGTIAWKTSQGGHFSELARTLDIEYSNLSSASWDGLRYVLSPMGLDLSNYQYLEMWVYGDGNKAQLAVDLGVVNEDSNGNGRLDTEDANGDFVLNSGEDVGIPPGGAYWGGSGALSNGWPSPGGDVLNTEDTNGNLLLDTSNRYFEYRIVVDWSGWNFVKIPLSFTSQPKTIQVDTTLGARSVSFVKTANAPDKAVVRCMRIWMTGTSATAVGGKIRLEAMAVTGNRWLLRTTTGTTIVVDSSKFNVSAISKETAAEYVPSLKFFEVLENDADRLEQALRIDYNLYDDLGGNYFASRSFPSAMNLLDYKELRFEIYKHRVLNDGEVLFLRAGGDDTNYYQFNIPLDHLGTGWQTIVIKLDDERNRTRVGSAALSSVKQFAIGIIRYDAPAANLTESLWINNLRLVNPNHKIGLARKVSVRMATPMGSTVMIDPGQDILPSNEGMVVDTTVRDVDNDFRLIDQPLFLFNDQHKRSVVSNAQIRQIPKLPITANWQREQAYVEQHHRSDPAYFFAPDKTFDSYNATVASEHLMPVYLDVKTSRQTENVRYLTNYAGADYQRVVWSVNPGARAPLEGWLFIIPLGRGGEVTASSRYSKDQLDYTPSNFFGNIYNRRTETLEEQYLARTSYRPFDSVRRQVPFLGGLITSPRGGYRMNRAKGRVGSVQVANISQPVSLVSEKRFQPVTQEITAGLENRVEGWKVFTPASTYDARVSKDFALHNLTTNTSLNNTLDIRPGEFWEYLQDQSFNLSYMIETNAQYYDVMAVDPVTKTRVVSESVTKLVPPKDIWWINRKDDNLSTANAFAETYTAGGRMLFYRLWSLTPNWSYREDTRLAQKLRTRTSSVTSGTGLSLTRGEVMSAFFKPTPLFWMNFSGFDSTYHFRKSTTFDFRDRPANVSESHSGTATVPFSPLRNLSGNLTVAMDKAIARTLPSVRTTQQSVRPGLGLGYSHSAGLEFPFFWYKIRLSNLITIRHNLQLNFIKNVAEGIKFGDRRANEMQDVTEVEYEMMRGISLRLRAQYDQVKDKTSPLNSFKAYSIFGTFLFNF